MALPLYLALTSPEMSEKLPERMAYMACHFSPGGPGLSNLPKVLPPGAMLILDDSMPMCDHDPERIAAQLKDLLTRHSCESLLLDFQRPQIPGQQELAEFLSRDLPCPVAVSALYAEGLPCPVFLPPVPPDKPLAHALSPWQGREIWLEAALDGITLTLTREGCTTSSLLDFPEGGFTDDKLHCHYAVQTNPQGAIFRLWRTPADLQRLLLDATELGVSRAIGLWQELHNLIPLHHGCEQPQNALPDP